MVLTPHKEYKSQHRLLKWITVDFLDVAVGAALTAVFLFIKATNLAEVAGILTILLAAGKHSLRTELKEMRDEVRDEMRPLFLLRQAIDIEQGSNIAQVDEIMKEYLRITDQEFRSVKDGVLLEAVQKLRQLSYQKTSDELATGEYYAWLIPMIGRVEKNQRIIAVSLMHDAEWDNSEPEEKFLQENLAAVRRGALVERVFIIPRNMLEAALQIEAVRLHAKEDMSSGLNGFLVIREELESRDADLLRRAGHGFFKMGEEVALVDKFSPKGEVRGYVTKNPSELHRLDTIFGQLKIQSKPLSLSAAQSRPTLVAPAPKAIEPPSQ